MTITATAPVPARCRLSSLDTLGLPRVDRLAVLDAAEFYGITAYQAFTFGARIRTSADVLAVAATLPPLTDLQAADLAAWCADVATWPLGQIARTWRCDLSTAAQLRDGIAGGAR